MRQLTKMIVLWLSLGSVLSATDFRYVRIDFPNSTLTFARGINARGDIVGQFQDANGVFHGFLLRKGVFSTIDFPDASRTGARGINARGDIVGGFSDGDGIEHGYLLRDGQFTQIDYPGAGITTARGINNAGDITGRHFDEFGGHESGFILKDGKFLDVHIPLGFTTDVWLAEDNGRVMVGDAAMRPDFGLHGYVRNGPGDFQIIDFPGLSVPCSGVRWINERGDMVGGFAYIDVIDDCYAGPPTHGFLLRQGEYTAIDFPGSTSTNVFGINDDGVMVGFFSDKKGNTHGFKAVPKE
jgi:probable HAF family extracellular repeat protein